MNSNKRKLVTDNYLFNNHYDVLEKERELIQRVSHEMPIDQMAIMNVGEAAEYLDVNRSTLKRWHDRGVLTAMVDEENGYKTYLVGHLWVFKVLLLDGDNDDTN